MYETHLRYTVKLKREPLVTDDSEAFSEGTLHSLVSPSSSYPSGIKEIISSCLMVFGYEIIYVLVMLTRV